MVSSIYAVIVHQLEVSNLSQSGKIWWLNMWDHLLFLVVMQWIMFKHFSTLVMYWYVPHFCYVNLCLWMTWLELTRKAWEWTTDYTVKQLSHFIQNTTEKYRRTYLDKPFNSILCLFHLYVFVYFTEVFKSDFWCSFEKLW